MKLTRLKTIRNAILGAAVLASTATPALAWNNASFADNLHNQTYQAKFEAGNENTYGLIDAWTDEDRNIAGFYTEVDQTWPLAGIDAGVEYNGGTFTPSTLRPLLKKEVLPGLTARVLPTNTDNWLPQVGLLGILQEGPIKLLGWIDADIGSGGLVNGEVEATLDVGLDLRPHVKATFYEGNAPAYKAGVQWSF